MEPEFLGDFNYVVCNTDSQKSLATTIAYSQELTDGSSGQESRGTYVLQADSDSARSRRADPPAAVYDSISLKSTSNVNQRLPLMEVTGDERSREASDSLGQLGAGEAGSEAGLHAYSLVSQETFTQTSKTILELAQTVKYNTDTHAVETQTSRLSIVENKTIEYRIEVSGSQTRFSRNEILAGSGRTPRLPRSSAGDSQDDSDGGSSGTLRIVDDGPETKSSSGLEPADVSSEENADTSNFTDSLDDEYRTKHDDQGEGSDESVAKSVDKDVEELYTKLEKSFDLRTFDRLPFNTPRYITLSPLTEETGTKAESKEVSRKDNVKTREIGDLFSRNLNQRRMSELKINKLCKEDRDREQWKLPPIQNQQRCSSPRRRPLSPGAEANARDAGRGDWAAGEGAGIATRTGSVASGDPHRLPAIRAPAPASRGDGAAPRPPPPETISIHAKIQQLKMQAQGGSKRVLYGSSTTASRSSSPGSASGRWACAGADVTARGCEALCADVVARLRHSCREAAVEVLEDIPRLFRGFWPALPEHRVADLLRLVTAQVESPRTQVARAACAAVAALLSNTNYTKKPEFDEAVAALLAKTGSTTRALRRAANLALDAVVAGVAPAPALAALCLFGAEHKSGLVRSAAARLLVVAAALAAGGRGLLRARPRSAAAARRLALRALAALLADRFQDTRMYAERLYRLLRPLAGFEAFFLADVDARTACRLMKKYDALLAPAPAPAPPR